MAQQDDHITIPLELASPEEQTLRRESALTGPWMGSHTSVTWDSLSRNLCTALGVALGRVLLGPGPEELSRVLGRAGRAVGSPKWSFSPDAPDDGIFEYTGWKHR